MIHFKRKKNGAEPRVLYTIILLNKDFVHNVSMLREYPRKTQGNGLGG